MNEEYRAEWCRYTLDFTFEARTSRGSMQHKDTYFIRIVSADGRQGVGEVPLFHGLSEEGTPEFENILADKCRNINHALKTPNCSSITFGIESALASLNREYRKPTQWELGQRGIPINGLVWMGDKKLMQSRIAQKIEQGFRIIKLKIGGINFEDEIDLISYIRRQFPASDLEIRLDANGAFSSTNALGRLERLYRYGIHSLEQPIKAGQTEAMAAICKESPIAIALDEELIGVRSYKEKVELAEAINPAYFVLKPALCGGFRSTSEYIEIAGQGKWWVTSALESNVGLYAIASWLSAYDTEMAQGLGTGMLYSNNFTSPLIMRYDKLWSDPNITSQNLDNLPWHR